MLNVTCIGTCSSATFSGSSLDCHKSVYLPPTLPHHTHSHAPPLSGAPQIELAQSEMPGLMACRVGGWWGAGGRPLEGARVAGCIHLTEQTAVLVDTLAALGADVR